MSEKITGVCVDIPEIILRARENKSLRDCIPNHWKCDRYVIAPEWISVAERLPELGKEVLWINKWGCMHVSSLSNYGIEWGEAGTVQTDVVTHWILLPEPPKAK